ncbi:MAG: hypothetical protein ACLS3M_12400 [Collinsella sp.]
MLLAGLGLGVGGSPAGVAFWSIVRRGVRAVLSWLVSLTGNLHGLDGSLGRQKRTRAVVPGVPSMVSQAFSMRCCIAVAESDVFIIQRDGLDLKTNARLVGALNARLDMLNHHAIIALRRGTGARGKRCERNLDIALPAGCTQDGSRRANIRRKNR